MDKQALIERAIREKLQVHGMYNGYFSELCPHALGWKNGKLQGLFYQFGGQSSQGTVMPGEGNWRWLEVSKLSGITLVPGEWYSLNSHSKPNSCIDVLLAEAV